MNEVEIDFAEGVAGTVTVIAAAGKQVFKTNKKGEIALLMDDKLLNENSEALFSPSTLRAGPS
ncbi:MAG: hypothetical protein WCD07_09010 [Burkholderiales bacterium]